MKHTLSIGVGITMVALAGVITWQTMENRSGDDMQGALTVGKASSSSVCGKVGGQCGGWCGTPGWLCTTDSTVGGGCLCKDQATVGCGLYNNTCAGTCPKAGDVCKANVQGCGCINACDALGNGLRKCGNPPPQSFYFDVQLHGACGYDKAASCNQLSGNMCMPIFVYRRCSTGLTCSKTDDQVTTSGSMGTCESYGSSSSHY